MTDNLTPFSAPYSAVLCIKAKHDVLKSFYYTQGTYASIQCGYK